MSRVTAIEFPPQTQSVWRRKFSPLLWRRLFWGLLFISPWLIGLFGLVLYPMVLSLYYSFTDYDIVDSPHWVGWMNYQQLFTDPNFIQSAQNTLYLVAFMVPLGLIVALGYAMLLSQPVPGQRVFRTIMYLPQLVPSVATAMLWIWLLNPQFGLINSVLNLFHITGPLWLNSMAWSKPSLILMNMWGVGGSMIIFLAGLQGVSPSLLEAARLDGANAWQRLRYVTLPAISPLILFNLVMGVLSTMQYFTEAFIMGGGSADAGAGTSVGVGGSLEFFAIYIYQLAFDDLRMGYASAFAWILFAIMMILVGVIFLSSRRWIHYEGWKWK